jgi:hypothetical protein
MAEAVTVEEFRAAVKAWVQSNNGNRQALAAFMELGGLQSLIDRWWIGTATPHPLLQAKVVRWIAEQKTP